MDQQNVGSKRSASGASGKIAAKTHETAEQLKDAVVGQANQVIEKARSTQDQTGERIRSVARQLQNVSNSLHEEDPLAARLADRASRGIDNVADYVSSATAQSLIRDTEQLARRQPALFFGSAFLLGLTAARFLKSSSPEPRFQRYQDDEEGPLARRQDRESGFFPSTPGGTSNQGQGENYNATGGSQRYQANYDAAFARDTSVGDAGAREANGPLGNGTDSAGRAAGRGNRP